MSKKLKPINDLSAMSVDELNAIVDEWVSSAEGQAELDAAEKAVRAAVEKVERDTRVDAEQLRKAVTL